MRPSITFRTNSFGHRVNVVLAAGAFLILQPMPTAQAFRVFDVPAVPGITDGGVLRWNAALHTVDGVERSLDGGLRYSIEGGSYTAFRDLLQWEGTTPSVSAVQQAFENAFAAWEAVDPESGLRTDVYFVPDFGTPVVIEPEPTTILERARLNRGAEIDISAAPLENLRSSAQSFADPALNFVTLTSGTANYQSVINSGTDIVLNSDFQWSLASLQQNLALNIGLGLGIGNPDMPPSVNPFNSQYYDDNYDDSSEATMLATLTNSFANLINPLDPDNSPGLGLFEPCGEALHPFCTGLDISGVDLLMEFGPEVRVSTPQNDEFAGRQFLYPYVPAGLAGDLDNNEMVNAADVDLLTTAIRLGTTDLMFDLDGSMAVDHGDVTHLVEVILGTNFGDADLNGAVTASGDGSVLLSNLGQPGPFGWADGNSNGHQDTVVTASADGATLLTNLGNDAAAVPEPSTLWLIVAGITVLAVRRHQRRQCVCALLPVATRS